MEQTEKLTREQQDELAGYYDTLVLYWGDELEPIREVCGGYNTIQYYNILKALDKKLTWFSKLGKYQATYLKLVRTKTDKFITKLSNEE